MYETNLYKKYTTLPHFHFNSSFGNIYKLNSKNLSYNNGVGYAISVDALSSYLDQLDKAKPGDVFAENSFGMPFLGKGKKWIEKFQYKLNRLSKAIKEKNFPIDAETLVNNYFKTVRKDPEGAKKILENNPATFAPIQVEKIPDRLFGLIKAKPEDGKKINKKIGNFLKDLKI